MSRIELQSIENYLNQQDKIIAELKDVIQKKQAEIFRLKDELEALKGKGEGC